MWVYQPSDETKHLTVPSALPEAAEAPASQPAPFQKETSAVPPSRTPPRKDRLRRARGQDLTRACAALAASYLFGALLSGVVLALCRSSELTFLSAYLENWSRLFVLDEPGAVWTLFGAEYLTVVGGATILLLLGLSAFGPVMIYLFAMLFGLGVGAVSLQLFLSAGWRSALFGLLFSGVPTAAAAACLCLFGASALHVSGRLQRTAFHGQAQTARTGAGSLVAQYLILNVLFLPICGVSTALACLAGQLGTF